MAEGREGKLGREEQTFPVPPSPTRTSLKVGGACALDASAMLSKGDPDMVCGVSEVKYEYRTAPTDVPQRLKIGDELGN